MTKILAIDDKEDNLITLSAILKSLIPECTVITALSGLEGIEKAKNESPDTILLDIKMPGLDGYEICKRLKENKNTRYIPVIMISAILTGSSDLIKGLDIGADAYLAKPIDEHVLIAQVKTALRMKTAEDTLRRQKDVLEEMVQERTAELTHSIIQMEHEIDERKKTEGMLKEREEKYRSLFEQSNDAIIIHHLNGDIIDFNQRALELLGYDHQQFLNMNVVQLHPDEELAVSNKAFQETRENGSARFETRFKRSDNKILDVEISSSIIDSAQKGIIQGVIRNITERKRVEEALMKSENRFRTIFEQSPIGIALIDSLTGDIYEVNPKFAEIAGRTLEEMSNIDWMSITHPDDVQEELDNMALLNAGEITGFNMNKRYIRPDGSYVWINMTIALTIVKDKSHPRHLCMIEDITIARKTAGEKEKLEAQLQQAQKMESVGRLAGGVAHDFNNVLSVIISTTELALDDMDSTGQLHEDLDEILMAAKRAADITRQLLAFARKQTIAPKVLALNNNVESMLTMLRRLIGEDIDLAWLPGASLWAVNMDPSQIDQILANLCVNARDAIEGVGKVSIESRNITFAEDYCTDHAGFVPGEFVHLSVSDSGCGMNKKTLENIFEPFFTTKDVDKGTGLGLSTVYGIVKQNKGFINVYSEPDKGTTINIYLLRHEAKEVEIHEESKEEIPTSQGETILVVEDDPAILKIMQKILQGLGYTVLISSAPEKTMDIVKKHTGKIHLLITDVIMPKMNGRDLAEQLQPVCPDVKCIFMSGYTSDVITPQGVLDKEVNFIQKPFSRRDLAEIVRKSLDEKNIGKEENYAQMKKILIIDDETSFRKILKKLLEKNSYKVIDAQNGNQGIKLFKELSPDLIITDLVMPEKEGLETIKEIRGLNPDIKIIAMSGGGVGEAGLYLNMAKKFGAQYSFAKPIDNEELLLAVKNLLHS